VTDRAPRGSLFANRRQVLKWSSAAGAVALVPALSGVRVARAGEGGDWSAPPDLAAAKEQATEFVTYGIPDDWANYGEVFKAFAAKNGFTLKHVDTDMSSLEEITKFDAEQSNPYAIAADIGIIFGPVAEAEEVVPDYLPPNAEQLPEGYKAATGGWVATFVGVPALVVNTDVVKNVPATWDDLLKPEYKGQIGSPGDPRTSGTAATTFLAWSYAHGGDVENLDPAVEFAKQLLPQYASAEASTELLEKGEIPMRIQYDFNGAAAVATLAERGINAKVVIPGVSIYAPSAMMINKYNEDKMDVAKMMLDYVLSDEAQIIFAEFGARPIRSVLNLGLELPDEAKAKWLPDSDYAQVVVVEDFAKIDATRIAEVWDDEVLGG